MDSDVKTLLKAICHVGIDIFTKDKIWYEYKETENLESCAVCKIKLCTGDRCRFSDCTHNYHADCIARYCDRVENKCPICKTEILDKLERFENINGTKSTST